MGTTNRARRKRRVRHPVVSLPPSAPHTLDGIEITRLSQQLEAGHRGLRFSEPLEALFRRDYELSARSPRAVVMVLAFVMVAVTPLYDVSILQAPSEYAHVTHQIQWYLMLPALVLGWIAQRGLPQASDSFKQATAIGAALAVWTGLTAQRAICGYYDFQFPHSFGVIVIAATFAMGRLRFFKLLPWALLMLVMSLAVELLRVRPPGESGGAAIYNSMSMLMLGTISAVAGWMFEYVWRASWLRQEIYRRLAIHDSLTGLSNRHHFQSIMAPLIEQARRAGEPITVMLIDIDHFKSYNDHYGHVAGDDCLRRVGGWLSSASRQPLDLRARLGGEEFVAVWFGVKAGEIAQRAESLREGIGRLGIDHSRSPVAAHVTASAGLIHGIPGPHSSPDSLMRGADAMLYVAKEAGRNRLTASFGSLDVARAGSTVVPFVGRAADVPN